MKFVSGSFLILLLITPFSSLIGMEEQKDCKYDKDPKKEFIFAAKFGDFDALRKAHAKGVPVDVLPFKDLNNLWASTTALLHAVHESVNTPDKHLPIIDYLLGHGADPNTANGTRVTPLMIVAYGIGEKSISVVRSLLLKNARVNIEAQPGHTALSCAQQTINNPKSSDEQKQRASEIHTLLRIKSNLEKWQ